MPLVRWDELGCLQFYLEVDPFVASFIWNHSDPLCQGVPTLQEQPLLVNHHCKISPDITDVLSSDSVLFHK